MTINSEFLNGRCHQSQEPDGPATRTGTMIAEAWEYIGLPARREMIVTVVSPTKAPHPTHAFTMVKRKDGGAHHTILILDEPAYDQVLSRAIVQDIG